MEMNKQSLATFPITAVQTVLGWATIAFCVGLVMLFGLQFPHSEKLDTVWLIVHLHNYLDPLLTTVAPYLNTKWPPTSINFLPLAVALGVWLTKLMVNVGLTRLRRAVAKLVPAPKEKTGKSMTMPLMRILVKIFIC